MELNKIFKSFILGLILAIISYVALSFVGGYKVETTMYVNDKYLKEMNEDAKYILSSLNYLDYLRDNSKLVKNIFKQTDEYTLSKGLLVEKPGEDSTVKLTFQTKSKDDAILFSKEYANLANKYILSWKTQYFTTMVDNLNRQYNELNTKTDIEKYRDALADSTISKLVTYKQIKEDQSDIIRITNYRIKGRFNKKIIVVLCFLIGAFIPVVYEMYFNKKQNN
ncbi:hypothetical protein [Sneathia vaginalis]|jgi:hypothetical protein|uniref:Uncharacterized protein n=1 Tax=Sneathia vaginalis TaxID=187101 RepID=A0A0E3ZBQ9_9FUSO|nr:hypothetical protein [Sneathia vaginalis]AKC95665.1 hypothetical protein VC03_03995 [Sneathia vaginalis]